MSETWLREQLAAWLAEDIGWGDATTNACVPATARCQGRFVMRAAGVVAGLECAREVFALLDGEVAFEALSADGERVSAGETVAVVRGPARPVLTGERLALNLLQRLSGIASLTRRYVDAVAGTRAVILDTRKTTPGLRRLEKAAVRAGGGRNHRFGLSDGVLIKDNHLVAAGSLTAAVGAARAGGYLLRVEVEVDRLEQIEEALAAGAEGILLDNMGPEQLRAAVALIGGRAFTEASGGVNLETVRAIAESGVDGISVGALTHSAPALDIGLDFEFV
ncbi:MAG TPA: carboxylating nicotinate-nucleotide diphosphorylase [Armatimonadetes bacterium]|nr:carboxylating nicotinate-nucleotide diphosphorylase [Armatimonadota bacterium]